MRTLHFTAAISTLALIGACAPDLTADDAGMEPEVMVDEMGGPQVGHNDEGDGVYVTSWLGGNSDSTTGDFSLGMRGHLIEKGKIGAPIGEMNVTGNLLELFGRLAEVGGDPWPFGSMSVPTLVFEGVQFSGK